MDLFIRMRGGLGNQLFQYAYAYAFSKLTNDDVKFHLDAREYDSYKVRSLEINNFKLIDNLDVIYNGKLAYDFKIKLFHIYQKLYKIIMRKSIHTINNRFSKKGFIFGGYYTPLPTKFNKKEMYLYGYFQKYTIFDKYRNDLKEMFELKEYNERLIEYKNSIKKESIALSIRLGKDIQQNGWTVFKENYYRNAIEYIYEKHKINQIVVYSDNIKYIKENSWFKDMNLDIIFIEDCSPCEQIELMRLSHHYVISNSTFSWWGAYLGYNDSSLIIAPKYWQDKNYLTKNSPIYMENMIILEE